MKILQKTFAVLLVLVTLGACTSDFEEQNINPNLIVTEDASAKFFLTEAMLRPYLPSRFAYWRGNLIHADRFGGHFTFGHSRCWWSDGLGYQYNGGYTDATWDHFNGYLPTIKQVLEFTEPGGEFENELTHAVALIIKSHYYQLYTDTFGEIPYSDLFKEDIDLPKFDTQREIYQGIIADLNTAMTTIGEETSTGNVIEDLGNNDVVYGGDLQKWKRFANTLKLKVAMRASGAPDNDFSETAIQEALEQPLLAEGESAVIEKDLEISQWEYATYGDIWYNFGDGSNWTVSRELVNFLRDNNDPRLEKYTQPALGGTATLQRPSATDNAAGHDLFPKRVAFIREVLDEAGATYTWTEGETEGNQTITVTMPEGENYVGQPVRLNGQMSGLAQYGFFCLPSEAVIQRKNRGGSAKPETVLLSAESFFLQAEAAVRGLVSGDAQALYQTGIREAMRLWEVNDGSIEEYLATQDMGMLNGTTEENLQKIAMQRWAAHYTDGYEAWAIVRDTGYPASLANGVDDYEIYDPGTIEQGRYPQRLRYGSNLQTFNPSGFAEAISRQGENVQGTTLWWAE
ncbi:SusD/RagB family nutrient-binding outer membrane lipoprotein [Tunicatimonas pelagia]|uniref:SusD/RagB family nutrient-binding outer membrane lipoprotein n=1 Tax=Tunicatimonas pelagia TaxID=931531 RepID=UPI002666E1BC|nr:SusD/RagB family nutrient-binding outer membrane lipoprotein [Tunicatimonas pelagia]WKN45090.1 SusD/RagB family nutrient-binding outer membrane lipoprotein [Tunicatimonas pelagia]